MSASDVVQRLLDQRAEQGLPRYVEDPAVIRRVATVLRAVDAQQARAA